MSKRSFLFGAVCGLLLGFSAACLVCGIVQNPPPGPAHPASWAPRKFVVPERPSGPMHLRPWKEFNGQNVYIVPLG